MPSPPVSSPQSRGPVLVLAITGASGAAYARRLLGVLLDAGCEVHLSISPAGRAVIAHELGVELDLDRFDAGPLLGGALGDAADVGGDADATGDGVEGNAVEGGLPPVYSRGAKWSRGAKLVYHHHHDLMAPIASGSFLTDGMVICPCSGGTLSAVVHGASTGLIQRAADVHLKERRKLILVPRETPLSLVQLDNMRRAAEVGAVVLPASPGFYHAPRTIDDLVDFVVARICDQLGVEQRLMRRWGEA